MYDTFKWIHVISAIALLFYVIVPFLSGSAATPTTAAGLHRLNRIGQYILILAFLTGGYMVSRAGLSGTWMAAAIVLILVMFAMAGMMGGPLKRLKSGSSGTSDHVRKLRTFSLVCAIAFIMLIVLMYNPTLF
ncbi:hypothetical protein [Paenibacillus koleovorans]|uniref:hypothetical protein n=1 Tax=Paenibacillus koleovorans TaxID=121608 RepID=UPI000FD9E25F|nr:hypothetical protein [Paenibacillus koleovorans]